MPSYVLSAATNPPPSPPYSFWAHVSEKAFPPHYSQVGRERGKKKIRTKVGGKYVLCVPSPNKKRRVFCLRFSRKQGQKYEL